MALEVTVGPPVSIVNHGYTFLVSEFDGSITVERCDSKAAYGNGRINFEVDLPPGATWHTCCKYDIAEGERLRRAPEERAHELDKSVSALNLADWKRVTTQITTSNEDFYRLYRQAVEDMTETPSPERFLTNFGPASWLISVAFRTPRITARPTRPSSTSLRCMKPGVIGHQNL